MTGRTPVTPLSWVQPEDLLVHELVQSADEGRDVAAVARRWQEGGGSLTAPVGGVSPEPAGPPLRALARLLHAELDALPADPDLLAAEPDTLDAIERLADPVRSVGRGGAPAGLLDRVHGAWLGRAAGCLLGKPVEKIPRSGIRELLQAGGRWPLAAYFSQDGVPQEVLDRWPWNRRSRSTSLQENIDGMPEDDDLNFALLALQVLERHGPGFTSGDVAAAWLSDLPAGRVFTAERVAYRNLLDGLGPPQTATVRNPFREWVGAQIRADVYGWTRPGRPWDAARAAWRDARVSHRGNGLYGAMAVAAMCAAAPVADDVEQVLAAGRSVVPSGSRYAAALDAGAGLGRSGLPQEQALDALHAQFGHRHWVHVLNNAALVAYALVSSGGRFGPAVCTAVSGGWDTDSDGATVGSVCGALAGAFALPGQWVLPLQGRLATSLPGWHDARFDDLARRTVALAGDA